MNPFFAQGQGEQPWLRTPNPPWHMWGTTETLVAPLTTQAVQSGPLPVPVARHQLSRVSYKRADSFRFFLAARLVNAPASPGTVEDGEFINLTVRFELIIGVGRSSYILTDFARFNWFYANSAAPTDRLKFLSTALSPANEEDATGLLAASRTPIDVLTAQDIQCTAVLHAFTPEAWFAPTDAATVEVTAYFAPNTHVRPDWLHPTGPLEQQFPGDEIGGR